MSETKSEINLGADWEQSKRLLLNWYTRYEAVRAERDELKAKHERVLQMLELAKVQLEGCRGAMAYAYEDRCDQYYLNVAENIIETLAKIESLK